MEGFSAVDSLHKEENFFDEVFESSSVRRWREVPFHRLGDATQNLGKDTEITDSIQDRWLSFTQ